MVFGKKPTGIGTTIKQILENMEKNDPNILGSIAMRKDGLILASAIRSGIDHDLAAAMIATILSVSSNVSKELRIGGLKDIVIKAKEGIVTVTPISEETVLGIIAEQNANLGLLLIEANKACSKISKVIDSL